MYRAFMIKPRDKGFHWILPWIFLLTTVTWFSRECIGQQVFPDPINGIVINITTDSLNVTLGDTLLVHADYSSTPNPHYVAWLKENGSRHTPIYVHDPPVDNAGRLVPLPPLPIRNITCRNSGNYVLFVNNSRGYHYSAPLSVCVIVPPNQPITDSAPGCCYHAPLCTPLRQGGNDIAVVEGRSENFNVNINSDPGLTFAEWLFNGDLINRTDPRYQNGDANNPSLVVNLVQRSDAGRYELYANNSVGPLYPHNCIYNLTVNYPPEIICGCNSTQCHVVNETESCNLAVNSIDAIPPVNAVQWFKGVNQINIGGRFKGGTSANPSLTVSDSISTDTGNYSVTVRNSIDQAQGCFCCCIVQFRPTCVLNFPYLYNVTEGNSFTVNVTITALPPPGFVDWTLNSVPLNRTGDRYFSGNSTTPSLSVRQIHRNDAGLYVLTANNTVGEIAVTDCRVNVTVYYLPLCTLLSNSTLVYNEGDTFTISVTLDSVPSAHIVDWSQNGFLVDRTGGRFVGGNSYSVPSLTFVSVTRRETGIYVLRATNIVGDIFDSARCLVNVTIQYPPDICQNGCPKNYTVCENTPVTLECTVDDALPRINRVMWRKNGVTLTISDPRYGGGNVSTPSLTIYSAVPGDQGAYECEVGNIVGPVVYQILLEVLSKPEVSVTRTDVVLIEGQSSSLGCSVDMRRNPPPVVVQWFKDGLQIDTTSDHYEHGDITLPSLTINNIQREDGGVYTCGAINSIGETQSLDIRVTVEYPPVVVVKYNNYGFPMYTNATLWCSVDANPPVSPGNVTWVRDGLFTLPSSYCSDVRPNVRLCNVESPTAGVYRCRAVHRLATRQSQDVNVHVRDACPIMVNRVRLAGGSANGSGRVEVLVGQIWGTVCGKYWTQVATDVVCRISGYSNGISAMNGGGSGPIHIGHVNCDTGATTLGQCRLTSISNCTHNQDTWVFCGPSPTTTVIPVTSTVTTTITPTVCSIVTSSDVYYIATIVLGVLLGLSLIINFAFVFGKYIAKKCQCQMPKSCNCWYSVTTTKTDGGDLKNDKDGENCTSGFCCCCGGIGGGGKNSAQGSKDQEKCNPAYEHNGETGGNAMGKWKRDKKVTIIDAPKPKKEKNSSQKSGTDYFPEGNCNGSLDENIGKPRDDEPKPVTKPQKDDKNRDKVRKMKKKQKEKPLTPSESDSKYVYRDTRPLLPPSNNGNHGKMILTPIGTSEDISSGDDQFAYGPGKQNDNTQLKPDDIRRYSTISDDNNDRGKRQKSRDRNRDKERKKSEEKPVPPSESESQDSSMGIGVPTDNEINKVIEQGTVVTRTDESEHGGFKLGPGLPDNEVHRRKYDDSPRHQTKFDNDNDKRKRSKSGGDQSNDSRNPGRDGRSRSRSKSTKRNKSDDRNRDKERKRQPTDGSKVRKRDKYESGKNRDKSSSSSSTSSTSSDDSENDKKKNSRSGGDQSKINRELKRERLTDDRSRSSRRKVTETDDIIYDTRNWRAMESDV